MKHLMGEKKLSLAGQFSRVQVNCFEHTALMLGEYKLFNLQNAKALGNYQGFHRQDLSRLPLPVLHNK